MKKFSFFSKFISSFLLKVYSKLIDKEVWPDFKFIFCLLLSVYSVLFSVYLLVSAFILLTAMFGDLVYSGSSLEDSMRWFFHHPLILIIFIIMMIPGILIMDWDNIVREYKKQKEDRDSLYLKHHR